MSKRLKLSFTIVLLSFMVAPKTVHSQSNRGTTDAPSAKEVEDFEEWTPPDSSKVAELARRYFDANTPSEEIPELAAEMITAVFDHGDIREKIWTLQEMIYARKQMGALSDDEIHKIHLLEGALRQTLSNERLRTLLQDLGLIGATAGLVALASGMGVTAAGTTRLLGATAGAVLRRPRLGNPVQWIRRMVSAPFRRLSAGERLLRDLSRLGVSAGDVAAIQLKILPVTAGQVSKIAGAKFYRTNQKKLSVAAISPFDFDSQGFGYFIFRLKPAGFRSKEPTAYFKTARFSEEEMNRMVSSFFVGKDHRKFVEIVNEEGLTEGANVVNRGLRERATDFRTRTSEVVNKFNTERASRALVGSAGVLSTGYFLGGIDNWRFADVYVGSLLSPAPSQRLPEEQEEGPPGKSPESPTERQLERQREQSGESD